MDNNLPLVTVITLSFNTGKYVIETIKSVKEQTYKNIEHIIIDDCSKDNSVELIQNWISANNYKCEFIKHEANLGICKSFNDGLNRANGKYICIVCDDIFLPEKVERQVAILEKSAENVGVVYSDAYLINDDGSPRYGWFIQNFRQFKEVPSGEIFDSLIDGNFIPAMSVMIPRSVFDEIGFFDENLSFEDYDMWLRISKKFRIIFSDYVSVKYRIYSQNTTATKKDWGKDLFYIYLKHKEIPVFQNKILSILLNAYERKLSYRFEIANVYKKSFTRNSLLIFSILNKIPFNVYKKVKGVFSIFGYAFK